MLDAKDGFWKVNLGKETSYLTKFWSTCGRLSWLRMPLGINKAPEEYQRRQRDNVSDLPGVAVIDDNHLVFGCSITMEEAYKHHENNLCRLLQRARTIGLRFNSAKMRLQHEEVSYLGHLISGNGLKPDLEKVAAVIKMQNPTDIKSMQRLTGFVNYLVKFLPILLIISEPLCKLSCKDANWTWQSESEAAFKKIKQLVTEAPVFQFYDVTKEVKIQCDASSSGWEQ